MVSGKNSSKTCFLLQNTRRKKANQGSSAIFLVSPRGLIYSWFLAKTQQKRVFCSEIREERRPIRAPLPFSVPPPRGHIYSWFLAKTHQKHDFCSKIREERRPIRAPLPFSVPSKRPLFIRVFWLKGTKNVFYAQLQRVCRDLGGAPD